MEPFKTKIHVSFGTNPEEQIVMSQCWLKKAHREQLRSVVPRAHTTVRRNLTHALHSAYVPFPTVPTL